MISLKTFIWWAISCSLMYCVLLFPALQFYNLILLFVVMIETIKSVENDGKKNETVDKNK